MARNAVIMLICVLIVGQIGCTPRTIVRKNPSDADTGIRYYRPKPWLLVTPVETITTNSKGDQTTTPGASFVNLELQYLPDFSEEYSISVRSGLGINNTTIKLEDGWNLTEIGQELDSQTAENVGAITELVTAVASAASAAKNIRMNNVRAESNVPIGYYESIIGQGQCGTKQIYVWRYVGFAPMQTCPLVSGGAECNDCSNLCLYSLVFRNGRMAFVPLAEVPPYQELESADSGSPGQEAVGANMLSDNLEQWIRRNFSQVAIRDFSLDEVDDQYVLGIVVDSPPDLEPAVLDALKSSLARELDVEPEAVEIQFKQR